MYWHLASTYRWHLSRSSRLRKSRYSCSPFNHSWAKHCSMVRRSSIWIHLVIETFKSQAMEEFCRYKQFMNLQVQDLWERYEILLKKENVAAKAGTEVLNANFPSTWRASYLHILLLKGEVRNSLSRTSVTPCPPPPPPFLLVEPRPEEDLKPES